MPEIEHNAPNFHYKVQYKRDRDEEQFTSVDISDWRQDHLIIENQEPFQQYRIRVIARNKHGDANVSPSEEIGYSGEDVPTEAPTNFSLVQVQSATTAWLSWHPVSEGSVRGHFKVTNSHSKCRNSTLNAMIIILSQGLHDKNLGRR